MGLAQKYPETGKDVEKGAMESLETKQGEFIRKLVRPEQTKAVKEAQVARTTEVGVGPLKRSVIAPTPQELRMEEAVKGVKGIAEKNTLTPFTASSILNSCGVGAMT